MSASSENSSINNTMTSVSDIMQITSTVNNISELESPQNDNAMTVQTNSDDDTSIHTDTGVTQVGSIGGVDAVTNSSILDVSSKLETSKDQEESTESPPISTRFLSTTTVRDELSTSDPSTSASPDNVMSSTGHSDLKSDDTLTSSDEVILTSQSTDFASTGRPIGPASQQSPDVSLVHEESTTPHESALQTSSKVPASSHSTDHRSLSTSILDSRSIDSFASTHTRKESISPSTSTRQYTWKTTYSGTLKPSMMISTAGKVTDTMGGTEGGGGSAVGYAVGATVSCLLLIVIIFAILVIYRKARKKTHNFSDQDVTDYRSLVKSPSKRPDNDASSAPFGAFPLSSIEETREETAIDFPLSASNFRAHWDLQLNGSKQTETPESVKEIPMENFSETSAENSESCVLNSFRPSDQKTTEIQ